MIKKTAHKQKLQLRSRHKQERKREYRNRRKENQTLLKLNVRYDTYRKFIIHMCVCVFICVLFPIHFISFPTFYIFYTTD